MINFIGRITAAVDRRVQAVKRRRNLRGTAGHSLENGHLDSLELLLLARQAGKPISLIYDVGGHIGKWTILARSVFPEAAIHIFEPLPAHQREIEKNLDGVSRTFLHPYALGLKDTQETIHIGTFSDTSSMLEPTVQLETLYGQKKVSELVVNIHTLDKLIENKELEIPDIIKLDVQGYELEVLKGGMGIMSRVKFILLEVSFVELYKGQPLFAEVIAFMNGLHFDIMGFGGNMRPGERPLQTDILFKNTLLIPDK
jgi:FkbM family methyltransferase